FSLGFTDFRVRYLNDSAKIQMPAAQMTKLLEMREEILIELKKYYKEVLLDLQAR
ncbi:MAG TPA: TIGR00268 family protein, partial [Lachnospiraceae bacterium]|nr:TIGR00268 family protein [Lachnospiraceae bacterium]